MFNKSALTLAILLSSIAVTGCSDDDKNNAPTDITLSNTTVSENVFGAEIGQISVVDEDADDTFTLSVETEGFEISGTTLKLADDFALNFEESETVSVHLVAIDSAENELVRRIELSVSDVLDVYAFTNAAGTESSVSYSGQTARHLLILELNNFIGSGLQTALENNELTSREEVYTKLLSYYRSTADLYELDLSQRTLTTETTPGSAQTTLSQVSSSLKDLSGKIAGNDATGQFKDWSTEFISFAGKGQYTPESLIESLLGEIADNAAAYIAGDTREDALGNTINKVYLAADGRDLKQLVQKILLGAVAYSQGTDDYLDNDIDGKGLLSDNTELSSGNQYTSLEHQFDEGFGYFGAAADYLDYTDQEIAAKGGRDGWSSGYHDTNGDGEIDFKSEYNFGHSQNAAKRDLGTADNASPTDYTSAAMQAFLSGRQIIADANASELTEAQMTALIEQRDIAVANWEKAIASTVVHYINDTLGDYEGWEGTAEQYTDLAKHWSELKGFFISLQFNPHSDITEEQLIEINSLIGDAPVLAAGDVAEYKTDLEAARTLLQTIYGFDSDNVSNW
jgi:hypothetical protein